MNRYITKDLAFNFLPPPPDYFHIRTKVRSNDNYEYCPYCKYVYHIDNTRSCMGYDDDNMTNCIVSGCFNCVNTIDCKNNEEIKKTIREYQKYSEKYSLPPLLIANNEEWDAEIMCPDCWLKELPTDH